MPDDTGKSAASAFRARVAGRTHVFGNLAELMAKATPRRSGDELAGVAASSAEERVAAQIALADVPPAHFLEEQLVPYEEDEVTRLIVDGHDRAAFAPVQGLSVGQFRDYLLDYATGSAELTALSPGLTPEMVAAVSKLMSNQDLVLVARKCSVITRFRSTIGLPGRLAVRLQPNHPTDDPKGIAASVCDGLFYGCGDAVIGINPATDSVGSTVTLLELLGELIQRHDIARGEARRARPRCRPRRAHDRSPPRPP
jgi:ethanolamine ammonia-lyase large subunit